MGSNRRSKNNPLFIVIDGGDGCGKDTQAKLVARYYLNKGMKVRVRSHPSVDNPFGRHAKSALKEGGKKGHLKAGFFYAIDVIRSLVKYYRHNNNEVIIFSRYLLGVCYLPSPIVNFGYNFFNWVLPTSRYFFYLDVTPEVARERISKRGEKEEMFETLSRLNKMRRKMQSVTKRKSWFQIDGNGSPSKVWLQIRQILVRLDTETIRGF
ncbi:MAG: thymidylate kinase [Candidatus Heimdallarchaeota archaeon]|nr:MAG: thymidylate kinase [Candidatus Heimdallarchaeota archaeon]